ncbi:MAG: DUF5320 domain-containing protein [candidate division Zixibacteria bacterium]|nr:DUF5320 domain-containing protein [candidate division Zixibacteria bacterium]
MPGGDRTGPSGAGPLSGRGAGLCSGNDFAGFANRRNWPGAGFNRGGNRAGRGRRRMNSVYGQGAQRGMQYSNDVNAQFDSQVFLEDEINALKQQSEQITKALQSIQKRLDEIQDSKE